MVVECDSFQYHSDKVSFTRDRRRDRVFKRNGYEVVRYSGPEIHRDPIGASSELYDYLCHIEESGQTELTEEMWDIGSEKQRTLSF